MTTTTTYNGTGKLADQWLLSAIGILTGHPHLLRSLFRPTLQEALGRYCIRLFKEANWINVFIDTLTACNASGNVRMTKKSCTAQPVQKLSGTQDLNYKCCRQQQRLAGCLSPPNRRGEAPLWGPPSLFSVPAASKVAGNLRLGDTRICCFWASSSRGAQVQRMNRFVQATPLTIAGTLL